MFFVGILVRIILYSVNCCEFFRELYLWGNYGKLLFPWTVLLMMSNPNRSLVFMIMIRLVPPRIVEISWNADSENWVQVLALRILSWKYFNLSSKNFRAYKMLWETIDPVFKHCLFMFYSWKSWDKKEQRFWQIQIRVYSLHFLFTAE